MDVPPSPKSQDHDVGEPVEVSVKDTSSGAVPDVGVTVNEATGAGGRAGLTVMVEVDEFEAVPLVAVRVAV
ncbi:hypothetical protein R4116_14590 [Listeria monocytogenes]|nr:hypothetical protein [Listeria monocytogenes]MDV7237622.1 hypothetical protein [Listeria monocytogenes]